MRCGETRQQFLQGFIGDFSMGKAEASVEELVG
jgi:hypothetical protein